MKDTYRHKGLRRKLIQSLSKRGITDERVLEAMERLPRHYFLDKAFEEKAYEDQPFPIGNQQTISQPYTVARMTELLEVQARQKVLEVGTGSGYQAALLALLGARVFTVERHAVLFQHARTLLEVLGLGSVRCFHRDGSEGLPEYAPFDRIIVTAGGDAIPAPLFEQLAIDGILLMPVGTGSQEMMRFKRLSEKRFQREELGQFRFVPLLKGKA